MTPSIFTGVSESGAFEGIDGRNIPLSGSFDVAEDIGADLNYEITGNSNAQAFEASHNIDPLTGELMLDDALTSPNSNEDNRVPGMDSSSVKSTSEMIVDSPVFWVNEMGFDRVAVSADGNADPDDIGATPAGLAMLAHLNLQEALVHYHVNSQVWKKPGNAKNEKMRVSAYGSAALMGFDESLFFDALTDFLAEGDNSATSRHLAAQIDASAADNQLLIVGAGPMDVIYHAVSLSDVTKRSFVKVLTHSHVNDTNTGNAGGRTRSDVEQLGVSFIDMPNQNGGFSTHKSYGPWSWMETHPDPKVRWVYERMQVGGKADISDAGMIYYLLTGDSDGNIEKLEDFFSNSAPTSQDIPDMFVLEGTEHTVVNLFDYFDDLQTSDASLTYEVVDNSNTSLFLDEPSIDAVTGELTLNYVLLGTGTADITIRASDPQGLFAEATFTVYLLDPESNTAPFVSQPTDVSVPSGTQTTQISLFDVFEDVQDSDSALLYEVVANSNPSLFAGSPSIDVATGELTLDYADVGTSQVTIRATDTGGLFSEVSFAVTVVPPEPNTSPTAGVLDDVRVVEGTTQSIISLFDVFEDAEDADSDLVYEVVAHTNPSLVQTGLPIDSETGELVLQFVEATVGSAEITVRATDTAGLFAEKTFTVTVDEATLPSSDLRIEAESYLSGTNGVEYFDKSAGNNGNASQFTDDVDVQVTRDISGEFNIQSTATDEYLTYRINILESGSYDLAFRVATGRNDRAFLVTIGGQSHLLEFGSTGGGNVWDTVTLPNITVEAGIQDIRVEFLKGSVKFNYFELVPIGPIPNTSPVVAAAIEDFTVDAGTASTVVSLFEVFEDAEDADVALTYDVVNNSNPSLFESPPSIDPLTGDLLLNYVPVGTGDSSLTVRATDREGLWVEQTFTVSIVDPLANTPPRLTAAGIANVAVTKGIESSVISLFDAFEDSQDSDEILVYEVVENTNPALFLDVPTIDQGTGQLVLTYADMEIGTAAVTVKVTDSEGLFVVQTFTVTVSEPAPPASILLEAESGMDIVNYRTESIGAASGDAVLSLKQQGMDEIGSVSFEFDAVSGAYDVIVGAFDENDGLAYFDLALNDVETNEIVDLGTVNLSNDLGSAKPGIRTFMTFLGASGVELTSGDVITVTGFEQGNEHARLDYIELVPA